MAYEIRKERFDCPCCAFDEVVDTARCETYEDFEQVVKDHNDNEYPHYARLSKPLTAEFRRMDLKAELANSVESGVKGGAYGAAFPFGIIYSIIKGASKGAVAEKVLKSIGGDRPLLLVPRYANRQDNGDGTVTVHLCSRSKQLDRADNHIDFL